MLVSGISRPRNALSRTPADDASSYLERVFEAPVWDTEGVPIGPPGDASDVGSDRLAQVF